jgi:hypothetical protein
VVVFTNFFGYLQLIAYGDDQCLSVACRQKNGKLQIQFYLYKLSNSWYIKSNYQLLTELADSMCELSNGKNMIVRLDSKLWDIIAANGLSSEIIYRIQKLMLRLDVIVDKLFIKTVKAQECLLKCLQLTEQLKSEIDNRHDTALLLLTRLESQIDDLVKKTHDFRIKAG